MGKSAIMSVRINGNADDAIKAMKRAAGQATAFGHVVGGIALKGVTALWDAARNMASDVAAMSDSTDKFKSTMNFAGLDTKAIDTAAKSARAYADATVYDLTTVQNTMAQLAANGVGDYDNLTKAAGNLNAIAGGNAETYNSVAMVLTQTAGAGKLTTENFNQLANAIPGASGKLQDALLKAGAYTGNFRDAMAKGEITAQEFNRAIMDLGMSDAAKEAATSTKTMEGALGNLEAAIKGGLTDAFDLIKPAVTSSIGTAANLIADYSGKIISNIRNFTSTLQETEGFKKFSNAVRSLGDALTSIGSVVGGVVGILASNLPSAFSSAADAGNSAGDALGTCAEIISTLAQAVSSFGEWVNANAEPITSALVGIGVGFAVFKVASIIETVTTALKGFSIATQIATIAQTAMNVVMSANPIGIVIVAIAGIVAALGYFFTQTETGRKMWANFTNFVTGSIQNLGAWFNGLGAKIGNMFNNAVTGAKAKFNDLINFVRGIPGAILGALGSVGNLLYNAGSSIIRGFLNGITSAFENVKNFVGGIAGWIAKHKGPLSYDAKLLIPAGNAIMAGLAKGLTAGFNSKVTTSIGRINSSMANMQFTAPALLTQAGGSVQSQPVNVTININGELIDDRTVGKLERMLKARAWERGR